MSQSAKQQPDGTDAYVDRAHEELRQHATSLVMAWEKLNAGRWNAAHGRGLQLAAKQLVRACERLRLSPACPLILPHHVALDQARSIAKGSARSLVYWLIFFLPYSPSLLRFSSLGSAFVSNCIMMDALIYGPRPTSMIEKLARAPPDRTLIKLKS